ncbi:MAG: adenosine deaminase [Lautropia sp.]
METPPDLDRLIARLPKAELHVHVVGALRPATLAELAARHGLALPRPIETLYRYGSFYDFIALFRLASRSLVKADDFARVLYEYVSDGHRAANLQHVECFFDPSYHYPFGVAYATQLDGLREGVRAARRDFGVTALLIPSVDREFGPALAEQVLDDVLSHRCDEVVGLGIDGPEDRGPPEAYEAVFRRAGAAGLRRTAHVCEDYAPTPAANYAACRDLLGCERLDHGYRVLTDPAMLARARDDGIAFTCCPKPSTPEREAGRIASIRAMRDAGLEVTLATDDPAMFGTDIGDAYRRFVAGLDAVTARTQVIEAARAGVRASWADARRKAELLAAIDALA